MASVVHIMERYEAGSGVKKALSMARADVIRTVRESGIRGRGGAGPDQPRAGDQAAQPARGARDLTFRNQGHEAAGAVSPDPQSFSGRTT